MAPTAEEDRDSGTVVPLGPPGSVYKGNSYEGIVRMSLMELGTNDPDGCLRQTNDYWKKCQRIGVSPQTCAALIYEAVKHRHQPTGEIVLREPTGGLGGDDTLAILQRNQDEIGLIYMPTVVREMMQRQGVSAEQAKGQLLAMARAGTLELRPDVASRVAPDDLAYVPAGPQGRVLTYGRLPAAVAGASESSAQAPTNRGEEWEVRIKRVKGVSINRIVALVDRRPDEITEHEIIYGEFYDDEKAQAFSRKLTAGGIISQYGPRRKMLAAEGGASDRSAYHWVDISFADVEDAEKFASLLEKSGTEIGTFVGGTKHGAIVTTNAQWKTIDRVLKKHRWKGAYSMPSQREAAAAEGDPSAMPPTVVAVAAVTPSAGEPTEVIMEPSAVPWVKVTRDVERYEACVRVADKVGPIKSARDVYRLLGEALNKEDQEVFVVVLLNLRGELRGVCEVARGQRSRVTVGPADVLRPVITSGAEGYIVVHNHPTGKATPSKADRQLTTTIAEATKPYGKEITFIDHVVIGLHQAFSICEDRLYRIK